MKTTIKLFVLIALVATACGKYEDGPAFSLLSKKSRLSGEWVVEKVEYNGADSTAAYVNAVGANYVLEIEKDGVYRTEGPAPDKGTWDLGEDKDDVRFLSDTEGSTEESYRILRLKKKELWMKQTQANGDLIEIHYKAKD